MRIAFITCPRVGVSYLQDSVRSALEQGRCTAPEEVGVFSDSLQPPEGLPPGVHVEGRDAEYLKQVPGPEVVDDTAKMDAKHMCSGRNMARASRWVAGAGAFGCVCEDDVVFAKGWDARCLELGQEGIKHSPAFVMAMIQYYPADSAHFAWARKVGPLWLMRWNNPDWYWGSQATLFSAAGALAVSEQRQGFLARADMGSYPKLRCNGDWGLKYAVMELGLKLYACDPNLVQHVGDVSTVCANPKPLRGATFYDGG